jgi:hypothetical protein
MLLMRSKRSGVSGWAGILIADMVELRGFGNSLGLLLRMLLTLLVAGPFPTDAVLFAGWGLAIVFAGLLLWSIPKLFQPATRRRGLIGLAVAFSLVVVGWLLMIGVVAFMLTHQKAA